MVKEKALKSLNLSGLKISFSDELQKLESWDSGPKGKIEQLLKVVSLAEKEIEDNSSSSALTWYGQNLVDGTYQFPVDVDRGIELLQRSMGMGGYDALTSLANIYSGSCPNASDEKYDDMSKALHYYKKSSELNDEYASYRAALCYYEGSGTKKDISKAIEYAQISKRQGMFYGNLLWGVWLIEGVLIEGDEDEAYNLFYQAYEETQKDSSTTPEWLVATLKYRLGLCVFFGLGIEQDRESGGALIYEAAELGDREAVCWVKEYEDHIAICGKFF